MPDKETRRSAMVYQFGELPGLLRIESAEALRALGHPVRSAILKELGTPRSVKELAQTLDLPVARLYHHVKQLLAYGFIVESEQRKAGSNTESVYEVAAGRIEVSSDLTTPWYSPDDVGAMVEQTARRFADAFRAAEQREQQGQPADPVGAWFMEAVTHVEPDEARELLARLQEALSDIRKRSRRAAPGSKTPPRPRLGIQIAVVPFPPSRERRYAEMRADAPGDPPAS